MGKENLDNRETPKSCEKNNTQRREASVLLQDSILLIVFILWPLSIRILSSVPGQSNHKPPNLKKI